MDAERESARRLDSEHRLVLLQSLNGDESSVVRPYSYASNDVETSTGYYILDVHSGDFSTLPGTVHDRGSPGTCMVVLGSRIYIFGTQINNSNAQKPSTCYFLDFAESSSNYTSISGGWKRGRPLIRPKWKLELGCAVAFSGKLYIFGDSDFEVYDPTQKPKPHWRRVKSTPAGTKWLIPPVLADHQNDRIIALFRLTDEETCSLYAYYPSREQWECVAEGFPTWFSYFDPVTIVDGVIYAHVPELEQQFFKAYDIATKQWLNVQVSPYAGNYKSYLPLYSCGYDSLVYLGDGILCLLASYQADPTQPAVVHVARFRVQLINNNDTKKLLVTPLSCNHYHLNSHCKVFHCVAL